VTHIDYDRQAIAVKTSSHVREEHYDFLIIAAGSVTNYFGKGDLEQYAFGLKHLSDAIVLRNHILRIFERASWVEDAGQKQAMTTLVVVGGGPTGLETAGALLELSDQVLRQEYVDFRDMRARVILIEASDHLLDPYPENLRQAALNQLQSLGVQVMLGSQMEAIGKDYVRLKDGRIISTYTLIWAAGVKASTVSAMLDVPLQRAGRVPVKPTLEVIGRDNIYVVGDMAYLEDPQGHPYPMLIPVAKQQGRLAAQNILKRLKDWEQQPFVYIDRGIMATIGRSRAVAWIFYRIQMTGYLAWVAWLLLHLIWLLGFRNRISVFVNWVWNYFVFPLPGAYGSRMILVADEHQPFEASPQPSPVAISADKSK
jgi:NADH dehydrogenase